ncbi:acyl-CoA N-acyltransferase [Nemania sp. NC0429]|nr:acyl-CoA N-acyltransferase [Nemania sp. NC0429]
MASQTTADKEDALVVEVVSDAGDFTEGFRCISEAFGRQARDAIWQAFNPGWETPEGQAAGASRMVKRWRSTTTDDKGNPNTVFLKATLPDPDPELPGGRRATVGFAVWVQASAVEGHGDVSAGDVGSSLDLEALHPGNESEQRFLRQMLRSFLKKRLAFVASKAAADPPAIMALDLCATHPAFQRRGVASALVRWGLDEARRRGIPDVVTEASSMGRGAYARLGFRPQGTDIEYEVDDEFAHRDLPPNLFMLYSPRGQE